MGPATPLRAVTATSVKPIPLPPPVNHGPHSCGERCLSSKGRLGGQAPHPAGESQGMVAAGGEGHSEGQRRMVSARRPCPGPMGPCVPASPLSPVGSWLHHSQCFLVPLQQGQHRAQPTLGVLQRGPGMGRCGGVDASERRWAGLSQLRAVTARSQEVVSMGTHSALSGLTAELPWKPWPVLQSAHRKLNEP